MPLRFLAWLFALAVIALLAVAALVQNNRLILLTESLKPETAATILHSAGDLYYSIRQYERGAQYFQLIMEKYPDSKRVASAYFYWIECMRFGHYRPARELIAACQDFLARYPDDPNADEVRTVEKESATMEGNSLDFKRIGLKEGVRSNRQ